MSAPFFLGRAPPGGSPSLSSGAGHSRPSFQGNATSNGHSSQAIVEPPENSVPYTNGFSTRGQDTLQRTAESQIQQPKPAFESDMMSMVRREVQQALGAASLPRQMHHAAPPAAPVQLIIQNSATVNSEQKVVNTPPPQPPAPMRPPPRNAWEHFEHGLSEFWSSPLNRICVFGALTLVVYIYQGQSQHRWRMLEMQRRIDNNPFLRLVSVFFGSSSSVAR
eukprot:TRINITY_DN4792_c0_g1_i1.p1 TRINITY_DN4792_c0_g1~~TRINITY_DN4792_c0_g1_i1.p1  ORF type:complete len:221 (-),score=36.51 TRINITY_DN4792_c0_g1_i1:346-1008(-)